jgi:arylsulfatase A-like enzyme
MASAEPKQPDILLIVLDCVRADLLEAEARGSHRMPFMEGLGDEATVCTAAVAPSTWTIPSHASLFTGLYPWDHGAHYKGSATLRQQHETIAERLGRHGYATASLSANLLVQPGTGLTRGFDFALWGGAREFLLRFAGNRLPSCPPPAGPATGTGQPLESQPSTGSAQWPTPRELLGNALITYTGLWDAINRIGDRVFRPDEPGIRGVCRWIEPQLASWLAKQPQRRPVFVFINLLEAHEPYLAGGGFDVGLRAWLRYAKIRQAPYRWIHGDWTPTGKEVSVIRGAYRSTLHTIDSRLRSILEVFGRARGLEDTALIITSDHGQAFMEEQSLYHQFKLSEPILRVPLWFRFPSGLALPKQRTEWLSLVDVPRTIADLAGCGVFGDPTSLSLISSGVIPEGRIVYSMADGISNNSVYTLSATRRRSLDVVEIAAYRGEEKMVVSDASEPVLYRVSRQSPSEGAIPVVRLPHAPELARAARDILRTVQAASSSMRGEELHGPTLEAWGY